jgi:TPR repeat protein
MARAQFNLALMYALGQGVPKDTVKAYAWFAVAAADGDPAAKQNRDFIEKSLTSAQKVKFKKAAQELAEKLKP